MPPFFLLFVELIISPPPCPTPRSRTVDRLTGETPKSERGPFFSTRPTPTNPLGRDEIHGPNMSLHPPKAHTSTQTDRHTKKNMKEAPRWEGQGLSHTYPGCRLSSGWKRQPVNSGSTSPAIVHCCAAIVRLLVGPFVSSIYTLVSGCLLYRPRMQQPFEWRGMSFSTVTPDI